MNYYSTRDINKEHGVRFATAVMNGLAPDSGLYMPEKLPSLTADFFDTIETKSNEVIAYEIAKAFIGDEIPDAILKQIVQETIDFPIPLVPIHDHIFSLELFHGPTMAFKDVGARFMARVMSYFIKEQIKQKVTVIVATSGDTGSAVAAGFHQVEGIDVFILYPKGKVSPLQEKQLTTWNDNIQAIEINGNFDDCQRIAKLLLSDEVLKQKRVLTSANSINIARLIPQSFYYAIAYKELKKYKKPIALSVPSGNFGNISAGLFLKLMGMPIHQFIASTNANDVFTQYLLSGIYDAKPSTATISNAMDVGAPSNFERMQQLFHQDLDTFRKHLKSYSVNDQTTADTMKEVYQSHHYILDPHGAVGYEGLQQFLQDNNEYVGVVLETAHPAKFKEVVEDVLQISVDIPAQLKIFLNKEKNAIACNNNYEEVKKLLL